jgi:hypothetical protein
VCIACRTKETTETVQIGAGREEMKLFLVIYSFPSSRNCVNWCGKGEIKLLLEYIFFKQQKLPKLMQK